MSKSKINEVTFLAPVPIKSGFKGNFGQKRSYETHPGTDIPAPSGTQIKAPLSGKVVNAKFGVPLCGGTIDIDYGNGFWSRFCHVKDIKVKNGDIVNRGDVVGLSGGGAGDYGKGNSQGPHLHFTLKKDGKKVNPLDYIESTDVGDFDLSKVSTGSTDSGSYDISDDDIDSLFNSGGVKKFDFWKAFSDTIVDIGKEKLNNVQEDIDRFEEILTYNKKIILEDLDFKNVMRGSKENKVGDKSILKGFMGDHVLSPVDGTIEVIDDSICGGLILIKTKNYENDGYIKICGVKSPFVSQGQKVYTGEKLGVSKTEKIEIEKKKNIKDDKSSNKKIKKSNKNIYQGTYKPYLTKKNFENLPYTLATYPVKASIDFVKYLIGIKEDIENIKKLLK